MINPVNIGSTSGLLWFTLFLGLDLQLSLSALSSPKKMKGLIYQDYLLSFPENVTFQFTEGDMFNPSKKSHFNLSKMVYVISVKETF